MSSLGLAKRRIFSYRACLTFSPQCLRRKPVVGIISNLSVSDATIGGIAKIELMNKSAFSLHQFCGSSR